MVDESKFKLVATDHGYPVYDYAFDETEMTKYLLDCIRDSIQTVMSGEYIAHNGSIAVCGDIRPDYSDFGGKEARIYYRAARSGPSSITLTIGGLTPFRIEYDMNSRLFSVEAR
jgi:hypothetical protein